MIFLRFCRILISIFCQYKDVTEIENVLNKDFVNVCDWLVDNKLSIHFGEDKTKCILFSRDKNLLSLTQHTLTIE